MVTTYRLGTLICALAGTSACLEPRAGSVHGDALDTVADSSADTTPDVPDTAVKPDTTVKPDTCDPGSLVATQGVVSFAGTELAQPLVALDGTTLYAVRRPIDRAPFVYRLVSVDVAAGAERELAVSEGEMILLDARDGALLYTTSDAATTTVLHHLDLESGKDTPLFKSEMSPNGNQTYLVPSRYVWDAPARLLERGAATWGEQRMGMGGQGARIARFSGGQIETLWEGQAQLTTPHLRDGNVIWMTYGQQNQLWLAQAGHTAQSIATGLIQRATLTSHAAFWLEDGRMMRRDLATGETHQLHDGPCALLVSDETHAASVCGKDAGANWFVAAPGRPVVFDQGDKPMELDKRGGDVVAGLALAAERIAWVEYPKDIGCTTTGAFGTGELVVTDLGAPQSPSLVAQVGSGCWCCNAYWPPMEVVLSPEGLAWNYPLPDPTEPAGTTGRVGWALFASACP